MITLCKTNPPLLTQIIVYQIWNCGTLFAQHVRMRLFVCEYTDSVIQTPSLASFRSTLHLDEVRFTVRHSTPIAPRIEIQASANASTNVLMMASL